MLRVGLTFVGHSTDTAGNTQRSVEESVMDFEEYYGTTYLAG